MNMVAATQSKVKRWIADHYDGDVLMGKTMWRIACECECAISTVYRAVKALIEVGAVNAQKQYIGRQFIQPAEIARYADCDRILALSQVRMEQMAHDLFAAPGAIYAGIRWGLIKAIFTEMNGYPGIRMLRVKAL